MGAFAELSSSLIQKLAQQELARQDFWEFCIYYDEEFFTKRDFLEDVAKAFTKIHTGEINSLSVSMPPRAGKSYITSLFCAWLIGKNPQGSVMRNCCTTTLYNKFSYDVREMIKSRKFKEVFTDVILSPDKTAITGWNTTEAKQVSYFGNGVGGTIIGFGADTVAITDDLYKSIEDATSPVIQEKVASWYDGSHKSRLEKGCPFIDIGTRWTKKDVIGINTDEGRYDQQIIIPALIDGKSFCEDVKTTTEYLKIQSELDSVLWEAEYMQNPIEAKGVLFPKGELNWFDDKDIERIHKEADSVIGYIDVADEGTDFLSFVLGFIIGNSIYITDVVFTKDNIDVTLPLCTGLIKQYNPSYVRVESNSAGSMFAKELRKDCGKTQILTVHNSKNKHTRILMESGFVKKYLYFCKNQDNNIHYRQFIENLISYTKDGKQKNDDAADSIAGLAKFISSFLQHLYA